MFRGHISKTVRRRFTESVLSRICAWFSVHLEVCSGGPAWRPTLDTPTFKPRNCNAAGFLNTEGNIRIELLVFRYLCEFEQHKRSSLPGFHRGGGSKNSGINYAKTAVSLVWCSWSNVSLTRLLTLFVIGVPRPPSLAPRTTCMSPVCGGLLPNHDFKPQRKSLILVRRWNCTQRVSEQKQRVCVFVPWHGVDLSRETGGFVSRDSQPGEAEMRSLTRKRSSACETMQNMRTTF